MRRIVATTCAVLVLLAAPAGAVEKKPAPDYSREALLSIFHDYYVEQEAQKEAGLEFQYGTGPNAIRFHFLPFMVPFDFLLGDGTSLRPMVNPFALLGVEFPYTPQMFGGGTNPKQFQKMLRRLEKRKAREREEQQ